MPSAHNPYLVVELAGQKCALPAATVVETMRPLPIQPAAKAPAFVTGMAVIRGRATAVVDLGVLLGSERRPPSRFVTVRAGDHTVALVVTAVLGLYEIEERQIAQMPPILSGAGRDAAEQIALQDGMLLSTLNGARLLSEDLSSTFARGVHDAG